MLINIVPGLVLNAFLALGALYKKSVTPMASAAGFVTGTSLYFFGGLQLWLTLAVFFLSSTIIGKIKTSSGKNAEKVLHKTGRRDCIQVFANTLPSLLCAGFYYFTKEILWLTASFASFSAANADTWASEIGIHSAKQPVSILTGKQVPAGISGGITVLGTASSAAGALIIALLSLTVASVNISRMLIILVCGIFGSLIDSILGAGLQAKYRDSVSGLVTEKPDGNDIAAGFAWMTNDMVNLLSITVAGAAAILLQLIIF